MIEVLVKYIEDKGFEVDVMPGYIVIRKKVQDRTFAAYWAIPKHDLRPDFEEVLFYEAHKRFRMIDEAIADHYYSAETEQFSRYRDYFSRYRDYFP